MSEMEVSQDRSPEQEHGPQTLCILVSQILVTAHKMGFRVSDEMGVRALDDTGVTLHLLPMLDAPHTQGTGALFQIILPTELLHQDAPLRFQTPTHSPLLRPSIISSPPRDPTIMLTPPETSHHPLSPLSPSITPSEIPLTPSPPLSPHRPLTPSEPPGSRARTDGNQPQFSQLSCLPPAHLCRCLRGTWGWPAPLHPAQGRQGVGLADNAEWGCRGLPPVPAQGCLGPFLGEEVGASTAFLDGEPACLVRGSTLETAPEGKTTPLLPTYQLWRVRGRPGWAPSGCGVVSPAPGPASWQGGHVCRHPPPHWSPTNMWRLPQTGDFLPLCSSLPSPSWPSSGPPP